MSVTDKVKEPVMIRLEKIESLWVESEWIRRESDGVDREKESRNEEERNKRRVRHTDLEDK